MMGHLQSCIFSFFNRIFNESFSFQMASNANGRIMNFSCSYFLELSSVTTCEICVEELE